MGRGRGPTPRRPARDAASRGDSARRSAPARTRRSSPGTGAAAHPQACRTARAPWRRRPRSRRAGTPRAAAPDTRSGARADPAPWHSSTSNRPSTARSRNRSSSGRRNTAPETPSSSNTRSSATSSPRAAASSRSAAVWLLDRLLATLTIRGHPRVDRRHPARPPRRQPPAAAVAARSSSLRSLPVTRRRSGANITYACASRASASRSPTNSISTRLATGPLAGLIEIPAHRRGRRRAQRQTTRPRALAQTSDQRRRQPAP